METGDLLFLTRAFSRSIESSYASILMVTAVSLLVLAPIGAVTILEGIPSRSIDVCNGCHGNRYDLVLGDPTISSPSTLCVGDSDQVTVSVTVTSDGKDSYYEFEMTVRLISQGSKVTVSSPWSFSNQRPSGSSSPYSWSQNVVFDIMGSSRGVDSLRAEATIDPDHEVGPRTRSATSGITVNDPPNLSAGSFGPAKGDTSTDFTFSVTYADPNGDLPVTMDMILDSSSYQMTVEDGSADTITVGEEYSITLKLPVGPHEYHFEASDGIANARFPVSGEELVGPTVGKANGLPVLSDPLVNPPSGTCGGEFTFSVTYTDEDGDVPVGGVLFLLNGTTPGTSMIAVTEGATNLRDGDLTNGERFEVTLSLDCSSYNHSFEASDGEGTTRLGPISGPLVSENPVLLIEIMEPIDGSIFPFNSNLNLTSKIISNVEVPDEVVIWISNISGYLGTGSFLDIVLEPGVHLLTVNVSSVGLSMSSEDSVIVTILEYTEPPIFLMWEPEGDIEMGEGENLTFKVQVNPDHPSLNDNRKKMVFFAVDDMVSSLGEVTWTFEPFWNDSGIHWISFALWIGEDPIEEHYIDWNITVLDVPAPIVVLSEPQSDLGAFNKSDILQVKLDIEDPLKRSLVVDWYIDGAGIGSQGINMSWTLKQGKWAHEGDHVLTAKVMNPDGNLLWFNFTYVLLPEDTTLPVGTDDDPDDAPDEDDTDDDIGTSDDDGDEREGRDLFRSLHGDPMGILILIIGAIAILVGTIYAISVLLRPGDVTPPTTVEVVWETEQEE